jgi:hypothetical protein
MIATLLIQYQMNSKMQFTKKNTNIHVIKKKNFGQRELNQFHGLKNLTQSLIPQINFYTDGILTVKLTFVIMLSIDTLIMVLAVKKH